jgi:hypothetical protein
MSLERQCGLRTIVCRALLVNLAGNERRRSLAELISSASRLVEDLSRCKHMQETVHGLWCSIIGR